MAENDTKSFREFLPDLSQERFVMMQDQDARTYAEAFKRDEQPPWLYSLWTHWRDLYQEPFRGITTDGVVRPGLFPVQDEGVPVADIALAADAVLELLDPTQRSRISYHIDSPEWRTWSNPEFLLSDKGIRLEEVNDDVREATLNVLKRTLSSEGYEKAVKAMRINGFLGRLIHAPQICNEYSYNFVLFGTPSATLPWGFSFYGHHLCLNVLLYRSQIVVSPCFTGAEPNLIDSVDDAHYGTRILQDEERTGLQLMQSLSPQLQAKAQVYKSLHDPAMPRGRWNHDDQRHLCGAYRDNRIVPYEGVRVSEMPSASKSLVTSVLSHFLAYLPPRARGLRLAQAESWFHETYFCWIGAFGNEDAFYYRVQSPVIIVEFDHHSGVFLTNEKPARFHIHTILRTPHGGDYGMALRSLMAGRKQEFVWSSQNALN